MPAPTTTSLEAPMRIGVVSDSHGGIVPWSTVHERVATLFEGVDLILHCGDTGTYEVLDALGAVAPVLAVRGGDDPDPRGDLVDGTRVLEFATARIGVTFSLTGPPIEATADDGLAFPARPASEIGDLLFGGPVAAVVFGGTHEALVERIEGILFVNPGSPTLADRTSVAVVTVAGNGEIGAAVHAIS